MAIKLSPQQREIFSLYARGECAKEIAHKLNTNPKVIWANMAKARERNNLINNAQLCLKAREEGIL